jgi:hypothetical protein
MKTARLEGAPFFLCAGVNGEIARGSNARIKDLSYRQKKQGAAGITTAAPYVAGQWGSGEDRLPG